MSPYRGTEGRLVAHVGRDDNHLDFADNERDFGLCAVERPGVFSFPGQGRVHYLPS